MLEESEIPLITMVNGLCYLNYIEFSLILSLFLLLFRKYLINKIIGFILRLKNKYNKKKEGISNTLESKSTSTPPSRVAPSAGGDTTTPPSRVAPSAGGDTSTSTPPRLGLLLGGGLAEGGKEELEEENVGSLNKSLNTLDKYSDFLIVFVFLCLFWIKFINIYYSSNLAGDIDSFVNVYNHIKN